MTLPSETAIQAELTRALSLAGAETPEGVARILAASLAQVRAELVAPESAADRAATQQELEQLRRAFELERLGKVVVTTSETGACVAVSRQDEEGRIVKLIWQAPASIPDGRSDLAWVNAWCAEHNARLSAEALVALRARLAKAPYPDFRKELAGLVGAVQSYDEAIENDEGDADVAWKALQTALVEAEKSLRRDAQAAAVRHSAADRLPAPRTLSVAESSVPAEVPWKAIPEGLAKGEYLVTVNSDDGALVRVLEFDGKGWLHEGEYTYQHGWYFEPVLYKPVPAAGVLPLSKDEAPEGPTGSNVLAFPSPSGRCS